MLLPAVITAHYVLKNAAKETVFAGNRLVLRVPFDMCIRKDAICSVVSARSVDERRLILQEIEAPCRARCHQHFCAIAHKALGTPVHTLGKSYVGCVDNMLLIILLTAMSVLIGLVRRLLVIMVARDNVDGLKWSSVLHGSNHRPCGFWFSSLVGLCRPRYSLHGGVEPRVEPDPRAGVDALVSVGVRGLRGVD